MSQDLFGETPLLLHNPRCSKSRQTKELLEERGTAFEVRLYLEKPLDADELRALANRLGGSLHGCIRKKEAAYSEAGLSETSSEEELARAMASAPILMERPVLIVGDRAAIGRPPESVLELLSS